MTTLYRIALLGFSPFERSTLGSYFRLASTREPRYEQAHLLPDADFVVADADDPASVKLVTAVERMPETVFVGARAPEGSISWLARPIDPLRVLRELDVMAARRLSGPARAADVPPEAASRRRTVIQPVRPQRPLPPPGLELDAGDDVLDLTLPDLDAPPAAATAPSPGLLPARSGAPIAPAVPAPPVAVSPAAVPPRPRPGSALLVDDSEVALRFLQRKLAPFGLVTDCVSHSAEAIERLARRRYDFIFLDMELGERSALDGLGLCQHIKREPAAANVVMITAHHTELDRVRGALAGCDGFLGKPLDDEELAMYLARFGVRPTAEAGRLVS